MGSSASDEEQEEHDEDARVAERKVYNTAFESELTGSSYSQPWIDDGGEVSSETNLEMTCMERKLKQALLFGYIQLDDEEQHDVADEPDREEQKKKKKKQKVIRFDDDPDAWCQQQDQLRARRKVAAFNQRKRKLRKALKTVPSRTAFPQPAWTPPRSPFGLVQEQLYTDPWKVIMACIFLHKTSGTQMKKVLDMFFERFPGPQQVLDAKEEELLPVIQSLGLYNQRIKLIKGFSRDYLYTDWTDVVQLHGVGPYAADAYTIFVQGRWKEVIPDDSMLDQYWHWLHMTQI